MSKSATVRARVEPALKARAEGILEKLGLTTTTAITLYYEQIVQRRGVPFEIALPNESTVWAMLDAEVGHGLTMAPNANELSLLLDAHD